MKESKITTGPKSQLDKFREAARELQTDESEAHFDAALKRIARAPSPTKNDPKKEG
jgi:hypothetical protein